MTPAGFSCDVGVQTDFVFKEEGIEEITTRLSLEILREHATSSIHKLLKGESDYVPKQLIHAKMYTDINRKDCDGNTYLHLAANQGFDEIVSLLISRGANLDAENKKQQTPLSLACISNHLEIAKKLMKSGAQCASAFSLIKEDRELLKLLDVDFKDENGLTPLFYAAKSNSTEFIDHFLDKGADINARNIWGETPIFFTINSDFSIMSNFSIFKHFVEKGADLQVKSSNGSTLLMCCMYSESWIISKYLIERGLGINTRNNNEQSPLFFSVKKKQSDITQLLIEKGADTREEVTIVDYIRVDHRFGEPTLSSLIKGGLDVNLRTNEGDTLLYKACKEFIRLFEEERDYYQLDFLKARIKEERKQQEAIINALIQAGARVTKREIDLMACSYFDPKRKVYNRLIEVFGSQRTERGELDRLRKID